MFVEESGGRFCKECVQGGVVDDLFDSIDNGAERVEDLGYLGNKLNAGGGCLGAATSRLRVGWVQDKELVEVFEGRSGQ